MRFNLPNLNQTVSSINSAVNQRSKFVEVKSAKLNFVLLNYLIQFGYIYGYYQNGRKLNVRMKFDVNGVNCLTKIRVINGFYKQIFASKRTFSLEREIKRRSLLYSGNWLYLAPNGQIHDDNSVLIYNIKGCRPILQIL